MSTPPLRIVSLLPSTTEIVGALGLAQHLVGVSHECDVCPDAAGLEEIIRAGCARVTVSDIDPSILSQGTIDGRVKESVRESLSLYSLREDLLRIASPTVVLTQALCDVCAPAADDVSATCTRLGASLPSAPKVHSFEPETLQQVGASFEAVAAACGVPDRGAALRAEFESRIAAVRRASASAAAAAPPAGAAAPTLMLLEWLDPPFDGGSWVPDLIDAAGAVPAPRRTASGLKSRGLSWDDVRASDPDVVVVACCGFDLGRNIADALGVAGAPLASLRAWKLGRVFAADGNRYFARPSPSLAGGAALLARVVWGAAAALPFTPPEGEGWLCLAPPAAADALPKPAAIPEGADLEDLGRPAASSGGGGTTASTEAALHERACAAGELFYTDPISGLSVMTRVAHERRGRCCGSGCRHCPFAHSGVAPAARTAKIQVPAFLVEGPAGGISAGADGGGVTVLFWSGGKDSFLALRALLGGEARAPGQGDPRSRVVLLTTFDRDSRVVAHQELAISAIVRQAAHLGVALVGVPLPRGAEAAACAGDYLSCVRAGIEVRPRHSPRVLHLSDIRAWREASVAAPLGLPLVCPIWAAPARSNYGALAADLAASGVPCTVAAIADARARALCAVGDEYDAGMRTRLEGAGLDAFGEAGELHTLAEVWRVSPSEALGVSL